MARNSSGTVDTAQTPTWLIPGPPPAHGEDYCPDVPGWWLADLAWLSAVVVCTPPIILTLRIRCNGVLIFSKVFSLAP